MHPEKNLQTIETALETLYGAPQPSTGFVARLETQLEAQARAADGRFADGRSFLQRTVQGVTMSRLRIAAAALLLALLCAAALTLIGPQRVIAAFQNWIGYVPGVGFVDLENTRLLTAPVAQTRDGVTVQIDQLIAGPRETVLTLSSAGVTASDADSDTLPPPLLRLPDGRTLTSHASSLTVGNGRYTFPPLPDGVYQVTLLLPRLPLLPAGAAPENWEIPLALRPADGEWAAELFPQPYRPRDAAVTRDGVTVRVVEVAHTPDVTAVKAQIEWEAAGWGFNLLRGGQTAPLLRDDLGHLYSQTHDNVGSVAVVRAIEERSEEAAPAPKQRQETLTFAPVSPAARELALTLEAIEFDLPANAAFTVDLGPNPRVGDVFPLDVTLDVAGFTVKITEARLLEVTEHVGPQETEQRVQLAFNIAPVADVAQRKLTLLHFEALPAGFNGSSSGFSFTDNRLRAALTLAQHAPIPTGALDVQIGRASVWLLGPWEIRWSIPGAAESGTQPR